jgi:transposase
MRQGRRWIYGTTMAAWVGKVTALASPLVEAVADHVMAAEKLHVGDTPVPVLAPGTGKTKTGRLWVYLRDERPFGGRAPPAVVYRYSPDRKAEHPRWQLARFHGFLQADGYSGFRPLYATANAQPATVTEVACWSHVRRNFYDIHVSNNAPIAGEALQRIGRLFDVDRTVMGLPPNSDGGFVKARLIDRVLNLRQRRGTAVEDRGLWWSSIDRLRVVAVYAFDRR